LLLRNIQRLNYYKPSELNLCDAFHSRVLRSKQDKRLLVSAYVLVRGERDGRSMWHVWGTW